MLNVDLLNALAPVPMPKRRAKLPGALFNPVHVVHGVYPHLPAVRRFITRGSVFMDSMEINIESLLAGKHGIAIKGKADQGIQVSLVVPTDLAAVLTGKWTPISKWAEVRFGPELKPMCLNADDTSVTLSWHSTPKLRLNYGTFVAWATEVSLESICIDLTGATPRYTGIPTKLVAPRIVWAENFNPEAEVKAPLHLRHREFPHVRDKVIEYVRLCQAEGRKCSDEGAYKYVAEDCGFASVIIGAILTQIVALIFNRLFYRA